MFYFLYQSEKFLKDTNFLLGISHCLISGLGFKDIQLKNILFKFLMFLNLHLLKSGSSLSDVQPLNIFFIFVTFSTSHKEISGNFFTALHFLNVASNNTAFDVSQLNMFGKVSKDSNSIKHF